MSNRIQGFKHSGFSARTWNRQHATRRKALLTALLAEISSEALRGDSLESILKRIVDCVVNRLPVAIASIILLNDEKTHFVQEVWSGELELMLPFEPPWSVEHGAAGRCARTGLPQLISDTASDADYIPGNIRVNSEYLVPIEHGGRLHGVLNLESTDASFFSAEVCSIFDAIAAQIAGAVHLARIVRELELANARLREWSMCDGLTGIANRRCFDQRLEETWQTHATSGKSLALLFVDVDCFKLLNDACGHLQGDEYLREIARVCATFISREAALVARYGGEEFAVLLPDCGLSEARLIAGRLRRQVEKSGLHHPCSPVSSRVTVSIGVCAMQPDDAVDATVLVDTADRALYAAKQAGRNRVVSRRVRRAVRGIGQKDS